MGEAVFLLLTMYMEIFGGAVLCILSSRSLFEGEYLNLSNEHDRRM